MTELCPVTNRKKACVHERGHRSRHRYARSIPRTKTIPASAVPVLEASSIPATTYASSLSGNHIDLEASFHWRFEPSRVDALVSGVVMQVSHTGEGVVLGLTGTTCDTGALEEFTLDPDQHVHLS